ncbi:MAG: T9SS type A sorting domain-containing protein [Saprospiraceae bacterium]|nr:T9SS type A sorting domain-containing protein [Saprospiraceae bacterium]
MKKWSLFLFIVFFCLKISLGCSCYRNYYCEFIKSEFTFAAFQAKVVDTVTYNDYNLAIYLEIMDTHKDLVGMTDTIKLYGSTVEAACAIHFLERFRLGDTVMMAMANEFESGFSITNPDSLSESYFEYYPHLCQFVGLRVHNNIIHGSIHEGVWEYPFPHFKESLSNCNYSDEVLQEYKCNHSTFTVFPNPTIGNFAFLKTENMRYRANSIRVFSADGRLVYQAENFEGRWSEPIKLENLPIGLSIIEITCLQRVHYLKVIVPQ